MSKVLRFNFLDLQDTWEGINEFLANNEVEIMKQGYGEKYGTEMIIYNSAIYVDRVRIDPDFNFGLSLGYSNKKWSKLVANYVNLDYLDLVKSEVLAREKNKSSSYNYTVHFDNKHGSGKDCLISLTFQRRVDNPNPIVHYHTRASEATKRMIFDWLLIQRMVEYVYGPDINVEAILWMPFIYINIEAFLIYLSYKGGPEKILKKDKKGNYSRYQELIFQKWNEFSSKHPDEIKYKVHKRAAEQIWKDPVTGRPLRGAKDLFARDMGLRYKELKMTEKTKNKLNQGLTGDTIK